MKPPVGGEVDLVIHQVAGERLQTFEIRESSNGAIDQTDAIQVHVPGAVRGKHQRATVAGEGIRQVVERMANARSAREPNDPSPCTLVAESFPLWRPVSLSLELVHSVL